MADPTKARFWVIYDGRARGGDTDDAAVLDTADSRREAAQAVTHHGDAVAFSYSLDGDDLADERGPYIASKYGLKHAGTVRR